MFAAAEELRFEYAAKLRDEIKELRRELNMAAASSHRQDPPQPRRSSAGIASVDHLLRPGRPHPARLRGASPGVVLVGAFIRATLTLAVVGGLAYELAGVRSMGVLPTAVAVLAGVIAVLR